jgi:2-polyprenyl-3-methyl-5-hydroxy-6-metoxy-1,4-benzoquinol methylase
MAAGEPVIRYFERVYPRLRGIGESGAATLVGRRFTEPGRDERLAWVLREFEGCAPQRVLDAGCGEGIYATALARAGHRVMALDVSDAMLSATRRRAATAGVTSRVDTVRADLRAWLPCDRFDTVLCLGVAEYYPRVPELLARLFAHASRRMLVTLSRDRQGSRALLRRLWLGIHGLRCRLYGDRDLEETCAGIAGAEIALTETSWTHCLSIRRGLCSPESRVPLEPRWPGRFPEALVRVRMPAGVTAGGVPA